MVTVEEFLSRPIAARVATTGPTIRPVWFHWDGDAFWWLAAKGSGVEESLRTGPQVALVVDTCDVTTGEMLELTVSGPAEVLPMSWEIAFRILARYLGTDSALWPEEGFIDLLYEPGSRLVRLRPQEAVELHDLSFRAIHPRPAAVDLTARSERRSRTR